MEENKEERIRKIISQEIKNALNEFDDDKIIVKKELNKPRKRYVTKEAEELLGERMTHGFELMSKLKKGVKGLKLIDLWTISSGHVGLFRYEDDGNAYEIVIRPVQEGKFKNLWGKLIKKK